MSTFLLITILFILLISLFFLNTTYQAALTFSKKDIRWQEKINSTLFFYQPVHNYLFKHSPTEELLFSATFVQSLVKFFIPLVLFNLFISTRSIDLSVSSHFVSLNFTDHYSLTYGTLLGFFFLFFFIEEYLAKVLGSHYPEMVFHYFSPFASFCMVIALPITAVFIKISHLFSRSVYYHALQNQASEEAKQELIDLIEETTLETQLDPHDKKLLASVLAFKDRIAREVMVPRVDVFGLSHDTTIEEAAAHLVTEGYSRTPVFKEALDDVVGVLMYKDILFQYMKFVKTQDRKILEAPIETLVKNIIYTPETKKISHLLQEFRKKQVHLAIIVDEYGGTEGIVTIEDILEEIVGDIADEYDDEEEALYLAAPEGGWFIDPRMSIFEIKDQFNIEIPQNGDYDTVGGYVFHETGTIPEKGYIISQPTFQLEVIRSNDRRVEKLKIDAIDQEEDLDQENRDSLES